MKLLIRRAGLLIPAFIIAVATPLGTTSAATVALEQEQEAVPPPAAGASAAANPQAKVLTLEQRADVFMARKRYEDAADYYLRALRESSSKSPALWNKLGIAFQEVGKFATAGKAYNKAIHADKSFAEAWNNLGTVYFMEKKYGKSLKYYQRAIVLEGDVAPFHMNLGTSYYHLKRFDEAVQEYRLALGIDPNVIKQQSAIGTVVHAAGTGADFYFYMAKAFASVGNAEEAVRYLRRALEDGFSDSKLIEKDPDFKKISQYPAFVELLRNPPVAIKD
jgi:tetratricopeptide (TPR) repeat protein